MKADSPFHLFFAFLVASILALCAVPAGAQTKGMVGATNGTVTIFDADTNTVITTLVLPGASSATGDCSITADGTKGFVTDFASKVHVIDLTTNTLAAGPNPIPIANFGEDTSISPDGLYGVTCDGSATQLVSVVDIALQTQVSTFATGHDCNSVDVCSDGSVLVTSFNLGRVRRLTLDGAGNLADTGEILTLGTTPNNVAYAPGAKTGIVVNGAADDIRSFTIPGLATVDTRRLSGHYGQGIVVSADGMRAYSRDLGFPEGWILEGWTYNPTTGALGATPFFTRATGMTQPQIDAFFGMDQLAIHPVTGELYVSQPSALNRFDQNTGAFVGTMPLGTSTPTGVCLQPAPPARSDLETLLQSFGLPQGIESSLLAKVHAAKAERARGNTKAACNQLSLPLKEASAQS